MLQPESAESRAALLQQLEGCYVGSPHAETWPGGRSEGLKRLQNWDISRYGRTRNFLDAPVSRLSPYLRHGMLNQVEVRDHLQQSYPQQPEMLEELFRQLAWRDFFEKVLEWHGRGLEDDLEEPKHSVRRDRRLPLDVVNAETGLPCMDGMLQQLFHDGYLHNHERLWFAAYLCHFRGIDWSAGAKLFRQYLYDGDFASNSSSWQWVASTFASKPYFMNQENIAKFSNERWCRDCKAICPFDAEYPALEQRLFRGSEAPLSKQNRFIIGEPTPSLATLPVGDIALSPTEAVIWVHDAALSWTDAAVQGDPQATVVFVFDRPRLLQEPWAYHRLAFVWDGLVDLFAHLPQRQKMILVGDPVQELTRVLQACQAKRLHISDHPNPGIRETAQSLTDQAEVILHPTKVLTNYNREPKRFSRYWESVAEQVLGYRPKSGGKWHK